VKYLHNYNGFVNEGWWDDVKSWFVGKPVDSSDVAQSKSTDSANPNKGTYAIKNSAHLVEILQKLAENPGQVKPTGPAEIQGVQTALAISGELAPDAVSGTLDNSTINAIKKFESKNSISSKSEGSSISSETLKALIVSVNA
jgi:hypothetical protein